MSEILLWVHPLMQVCAAVLGIWALWQGLKRVAMLLGKKTLFPWPIIGLAILGLITGYIMNRYKKKRKILPLIHGAINVLLIILVAVECYTGVQVWKDFS